MTTPIATQVLTRAKLSADYRIAVAYGGALSPTYAHARYAPAQGVLLDLAKDVQAECDRVGAIYAKQRQLVTVTVEWGTYRPGDVYTLQHPRYDLAAGVPAMIVGMAPDVVGRTIKLTLWI